MDEHKTPEEIINDNAAPDAPETDAPEACAQPEEVTAGEHAAGEADTAEVPAPAEKKPMKSDKPLIPHGIAPPAEKKDLISDCLPEKASPARSTPTAKARMVK